VALQITVERNGLPLHSTIVRTPSAAASSQTTAHGKLDSGARRRPTLPTGGIWWRRIKSRFAVPSAPDGSIGAESEGFQVAAKREAIADPPRSRHTNETESSSWPILLSESNWWWLLLPASGVRQDQMICAHYWLSDT